MESKRALEYAEKNRIWRKLIGDWKRGGLTQTEYCQRNNLDPRKFLYWKKKILTKSDSATLVELPAQLIKQSSPPASSLHLVLVIDDRFRVEVPLGFDDDTLRRLVKVLSMP